MKSKLKSVSAICLILAASVYADDGEGEHHRQRGARQPDAAMAKAPAVWKTECGSCHMAFPPGMLPATAWKKQMDTLQQHYGSNATLDAADEKAIRDFLQLASAANRQPVPASKPGEPPRITSTAWFRHEHDEISAAVWRRKSVGSAANCMACHSGAERGNFDEDGVKIPR